MLYTFGRKTAYDKILANDPSPKKLGRRLVGDARFPDGYAGGSVWQTVDEAQAYVNSLPNADNPTWAAADFAVYGVKADWDSDAYQIKGKAWRSLLVDAPLVCVQATDYITVKQA